jgi:hypothetical protein
MIKHVRRNVRELLSFFSGEIIPKRSDFLRKRYKLAPFSGNDVPKRFSVAPFSGNDVPKRFSVAPFRYKLHSIKVKILFYF